MKNLLLSYWFWGILLSSFVVIIMWDDKIEESAINAYIKHRMVLRDVNFSQVEAGFEHARLYADICEMDENQNNMEASNIRTMFFKANVATWTGRLLAERAIKNPFEAKFWGDVRAWNSDRERIKTEELRYYFNRKELHSQKPVTLWKDDAVITGLGMSYNTQTKEAIINQQVMIRIWNQNASPTADRQGESMSSLPVAPPIEELLIPLRNLASQPVIATAASELTNQIRNKKP